MAILQPFIDQSAQAVVSAVTSATGGASAAIFGRIFGLFVSIAVLQWGIKVYKGQEQLDGASPVLKLLKFVLIGLAGLSVASPRIGFTISGFILDLPAALGALLGVSSDPSALIDGVLERSLQVGERYFTLAASSYFLTPSSLILTLIGIVTIIVGCIVAGGAFFMYLFAKLGLGFAIVVAPIAFLCLLLESTSKWFGSWLGYVVGSAVLFIANAFVLGVVFAILGAALDAVVTPGDGSITPMTLRGAAAYFICFCVAGFAVFKAEQKAFAIAGSSGASSAGFMTMVLGGSFATVKAVSGAAGGIANGARGALAGARGKVNRRNGGTGYRVGAALGTTGRYMGQALSRMVKGSPESGGSVTGGGGNSVRQSGTRFKTKG